uniref:Nitrate reductase [NADPH] n=1 Tax=Neurospora crassa (strain ATCC 24698 / 74-OR23-1A / CBS 708.71 / DSM 1257 / FGSC 987) TaxID=367110 RepID=NIA_NEUCR|nr:RecName: Full=Nitrate reductase [NADPH]; Short=NR [Neurospora crassa OR74A]CAA43600.1 nitrate reductase (NADPH) [Neurospora crassa]
MEAPALEQRQSLHDSSERQQRFTSLILPNGVGCSSREEPQGSGGLLVPHNDNDIDNDLASTRTASPTTTDFSSSSSDDNSTTLETSVNYSHSSNTNTNTSCPPSPITSSSLKPAYPLPPPSTRLTTILPTDLKTPDHLIRDPRLIRLTGSHPFNVEPPLTALFEHGFLTPQNLHYVRNHGPIPSSVATPPATINKEEDDSLLNWEFTVEGLVEHPLKISVRELMDASKWDNVTYPVTLVCAGNRRKEQNVLRKSKGFSWGAGGLSTALWTGVGLSEILARAKPLTKKGGGARYVCFEGADQLPNGTYGTSVKLAWAMDPNKGIMVAHKMNGENLHPDHGRPVRVVVPGQIGGRSVKWLKRIVVTKGPSENWYHVFDNRVLPTTVGPEESGEKTEEMERVWRDERYAIYDLNVNSVICEPGHGEVVSLRGDEGAGTYRLRGYAYAGGGRRVTRLEVTLDQGKSWRLAGIEYPEDRYREAQDGEELFGGRLDVSWRESCFCWCFWDLEIPLSELRKAKDVCIRAMDESLALQPKEMYWSVLGMMNNPWFRVVIHHEGDTLRFEHPTQPMLTSDGWMDRVKKEGGNLANGFWGEKVPGAEENVVKEEPVKEISMVDEKVTRLITLEELRQHDGEEEPWFVVNGQVYNGTPFLEGHPGGAASITGAAGQDVTDEFLAIHSENAKAMMPTYHIGTLTPSAPAALKSSSTSDPALSDPSRPIFLQSKTWNSAILTFKESVSPDTKIFHFALSHPAQSIGLPVGQHLMMRLPDPAKPTESIIRAYTPISDGTLERGTLRVLVKIYYASPTEDIKGGQMTQALDALALGKAVEFKGPVGKFVYQGRGVCSVNGRERKVKRFVMVCGGSGVTPIYQVAEAVAVDDQDGTECLVLDGNRVEGDILMKSELDELVERAKPMGRCRVKYTLSRPGAEWEGLRGRLDKTMLEREVGEGDLRGETMVLLCGPEGMQNMVREVLKGMGWKDEDVLVF